MNSKLRSMIFVVGTLALGCAGTLPPPDGSCGVFTAGQWDNRLGANLLPQSEVERQVRLALDGTTLTTDIKLMDMTENCRALNGFSVYTLDGPWQDGKYNVLGTTTCWSKIIKVAKPGDGNWLHSALIHELFHAMQKCSATPPIDSGSDDWHSNWVRDGIYDAIDFERGLK